MSQPTPKSYEQILSEMISTYLAKTGINDLNPGSAVLSFFETVAQSVSRASGDTFSILRDYSVDRAVGEALKRIAAEENVTVEPARVATGLITVSDSSFNKISSKIYAGSNPPNIGSTIIKVSDASEFSATGQVYIGRGTPNIEGPLSYLSVTAVGGYYEILLTTPTAKFHNISESVIQAQGGVRNILSGTSVRAPSAGGAPDIVFTTTQSAIILDGENSISGIAVAAQEPGTEGNVPAGAVKQFDSAPFAGAVVTNSLPFTTGKNEDTDDEIRAKIKRARISRGLGTSVAVKNSVLGAQAPDENARIISDEIFADANSATLYIDDGQGYEEKTKGIGLEFIVDSALGGETHFKLATGGSQTSISQAFLESSNSEPFSIYPNNRLSILVGGVLNEHVFASGDFRSDGYATAFELAASINANPNVDFVARTAGNGTRLVINAKTEDNEYLQITTPTIGDDAGVALNFTSNEVQTLRLYKNRRPLSRNGNTAQVESSTQAEWASTISSGETLILRVDSTSYITYSILSSDFIDEGTYPSVSKSNSLQSWVNVFNSKLIGITASINGSRIVLESNRGTSAKAKLEIDSASTLVSKGMFTASLGLVSTGASADFTLSRNTAQFKLLSPLTSGDSLTAGTEFSKAEIQSNPILGGNVTFSSDAYLWFLIDQPDAEIINSGVASDTFISVSKPSVNIVRYTSSVATAFNNVNVGDYFILWSTELNVNNRLEGRVNAKTATTFDVKVTPVEYAAAVPQVLVQFKEGIVFIRTERSPQKVQFVAGSYNVNTIASNLSNNVIGVSASVVNDEIIVLTADTIDTYGIIHLITFNDSAKSLNLTSNTKATSIESLYAFYESQNQDGYFPSFLHSSITNNQQADTPTSTIPSFASAVSLASDDSYINGIVSFLHPFLTSGVKVNDAQPAKQLIQADSYAGLTVNVSPSQFVRRLRSADRYFLANPLNFAFNDSAVVVLDNDASNKTFPIPFYRKASPNNTMPTNSNQFRAYDIDSGATSQFTTFFGSSFSFKNYKVLMKARNVIDPSGSVNEDAVLFRSATWGSSGDLNKVGYGYPTSANQPISHVISISDKVYVKINIKSGNTVTSQIDGTTEWNVTVTPNTPVAGVDEVTYTWSGVGTNPNMVALASGNYVTINTNGGFSLANTGTFQVISSTSSSFTVHRPNGAALAESSIGTLVSNTISLYSSDNTTAQEIVTYVTANLSDFITAELVNDNGLTGAGVVSFSTYEDTDYVSEYVSLVDGINWIASSNLSAVSPNPQFTLKKPLTLSSFSTNTANAYTFNSGEEIRFIPTTYKQVSELISVLAVSGFTTLGNVSISDRESRLQLSSQVLGSGGAVQVTGGSANEAAALVSNQSLPLASNTLLQITIPRSSSGGIQGGQWIKLSALESQKKHTDIIDLTTVTTHPNTVVLGSTVIELGNKQPDQNLFGQPRSSFKDLARAFHVEKHGSLVCISWDGLTGSNPLFDKTVEINADSGNIQVEWDIANSLTNYIITSGSRNFSEVQVGDSFTIQNLASASNNGSFKIVGISEDKKTISTDNSQGVDAVAASVASGDLVITTEIQENDTVEIGSPFSSLNQGTFRLIRKYGNSFYIDNSSAVEERIVVSENLRSLSFNATTQFDVSSVGDMRIEWNGTGTQPSFENCSLGDTLIVGTAFNAANQGQFMVTKFNRAENGKFTIECPSGSQIAGGTRFDWDLPNGGTSYYDWFDVNNTSTDPAPISKTGVEHNITGTESADAIAVIVAADLNAVSGISATVNGSIVTVTFDDVGPAVNAVNVNVNELTITIIEQGSKSFVECANAKAIAESGVSVTGVGGNVLKSHATSMVFSPYENTRSGDSFVVSGSVLGESNQGSYSIQKVLDKTRVAISNLLTVKTEISLSGNSVQIYVQEGTPYTGYKKIQYTVVDPSNSDNFLVVVDSVKQFEKINAIGVITAQGVGKASFPTLIKRGLDSYRYHTGLIAQANKIVYGDPRDSVTFPGVAAAGAEIYIKPPLFKRIKVSINVRVRTGIPFSRVAEQVRNNVAALINSTKIGEAIAISDIVAAVNVIPGVFAVSISSPAYDAANDIITVNAIEKPRVIDIINDISVSKIE
jgi:uncharacterized phage protein gp47/JayE